MKIWPSVLKICWANLRGEELTFVLSYEIGEIFEDLEILKIWLSAQNVC